MVLALPATLSDLFFALRLLFYRMVKRVRRLVSGQTEVARICGDQRHADIAPHTSQMTAALWQEWNTSKRLHALFEERAKDPNMSVSDTAARICDAKNIGESPGVSENLRKCLQEIRQVNRFIAKVKQVAGQKYSAENLEDERKLETLWKLLLPDVQRSGGRYTREWGRIGFQQSDPASDFRGGGVLSLDQLLFIASTRRRMAQKMISEPQAETARYPWACAGINLTAEALRMLEERKIDQTLYGKSTEEAWGVFNGFYADMFEVLHANWMKAGAENVLAFPGVWKETMSQIEDEVGRNGSVVPPGTEG